MVYKKLFLCVVWHWSNIIHIFQGYFTCTCHTACAMWCIYPYSPGLLHWHWGNHTIAPVPEEQPWRMGVNTSHGPLQPDNLITTKQSTTKTMHIFYGMYPISPLLHKLWYLLWRLSRKSGLHCTGARHVFSATRASSRATTSASCLSSTTITPRPPHHKMHKLFLQVPQLCQCGETSFWVMNR